MCPVNLDNVEYEVSGARSVRGVLGMYWWACRRCATFSNLFSSKYSDRGCGAFVCFVRGVRPPERVLIDWILIMQF
jgi:hypothetical protein